jgi:cytoskeletal protein CcmA (bactofilin family)
MKIAKMLKTKPGLYGAVAATTVVVVVGGYLGYKAVAKPKLNSNAKPATVQTPAASKPTTATPAVKDPVNYNGTYTGSTNVTQGIASTSATVSANNTITGNAVYKGPFNSQIPISITGTVDSKGMVSGTVSGGGTVQNISINVSGSFKGSIKDGTATVNYTIKANGVSASSSITLKKQ